MIPPTVNPEKRLALVLVGAIFGGELLIMLAFSVFPPLPQMFEAFLDASLLALFCVPLVYFQVFRPIRQKMMALHHAQEQLQITSAAFETNDAIMITDAKATIVKVNQAFERITGYDEKEILGKNPRILKSGIHDEQFYEEMWKGILKNGTWKGEIWDRHKNGKLYPKEATITAIRNKTGETIQYVAIFNDISDRIATEEKIHKLAFYDALTGLPNRRFLIERLGSSLATSARNYHYGALFFLDMDNFKTLNDTMGHDYGDMLLQQVAMRIEGCLREVDTVGRLGGDEFVVILENLSIDETEASHKADQVAEKIRSELALPYKLNEQVHNSTPSIGACLFYGHTLGLEELIKRSDMAMYQAKGAGKNRVRFFDPHMQELVEARARVESDLIMALREHQLVLYYQLQVGSEGESIGAEVLVRWMHPERGMVSPAEFIPIAEESSLMLEIGDWILEESCRQLSVWHMHADMRHLSLSVNISGQQFKQADFVEQVAKKLQKYEFDASRLKLELTESVALDDIDFVIAKMLSLKMVLGVKLSLDDFGTGYSSLSYLNRLPFDQLKIDRSFVNDITRNASDANMVKTILTMALNFDLEVVAEGVETAEQLAFLQDNGCMAFQGYFFSKPVPLGLFEALAVKHQQEPAV